MNFSKFFKLLLLLSSILWAEFSFGNDLDNSSNAFCRDYLNAQTAEVYLNKIAPNLFTLQLMHIGNFSKAKDVLSSETATFILDNYFMLSDKNCPIGDKSRDNGYQLLRMLAVMNEVYPNKVWMNNPEILEIFEKVKKMDPAKTNLLRKRDWTVGI